jgi:hypothetical protein
MEDAAEKSRESDEILGYNRLCQQDVGASMRGGALNTGRELRGAGGEGKPAKSSGKLRPMARFRQPKRVIEASSLHNPPRNTEFFRSPLEVVLVT